MGSVGPRFPHAAAQEVAIASRTSTFSSAKSAGSGAGVPGAAHAERNGVVNSSQPARIRVRWVGLNAPSRLTSIPRMVCQVRSPAAPTRNIATPTRPIPYPTGNPWRPAPGGSGGTVPRPEGARDDPTVAAGPPDETGPRQRHAVHTSQPTIAKVPEESTACQRVKNESTRPL